MHNTAWRLQAFNPVRPWKLPAAKYIDATSGREIVSDSVFVNNADVRTAALCRMHALALCAAM